MNDLYVAGGIAVLSGTLLLIGVARRKHDSEYRIWTNAGLGFLAFAFAALFFTLGNTIDQVGEAFTQFGEEFSNFGDPDSGDPDAPTEPTFPEDTFPEDTSGG